MVIATSTIRANTFTVIYDLINNNLLTGWSVAAAFPDATINHPMILVNPVQVVSPVICVDGATQQFEVEVTIDLYSSRQHGPSKIDVGRDFLHNLIISNQASLSTEGLEFDDDLFEDSTVDTIEFNNQKFHMASCLIRFILK